MFEMFGTFRIFIRHIWKTTPKLSFVVLTASFALFLASTEMRAQAPEEKKTFKPDEQCYSPKAGDEKSQSDEFRDLDSTKRRGTGSLAIEGRYLGTGSQIDVGLSRDHKDGLFYFAALVQDKGHAYRIIDARKIIYRKASQADALVKSGKITAGQTILNLRFEEELTDVWSAASLYVYNCNGSPQDVVRLDVTVSSATWTLGLSLAALFLFYLIAMFAISDRTTGIRLNPLYAVAGSDGRASLAKFQILFFTLIVFYLVTYFLLRTGMLSEISAAILSLMGIGGVGATAAKAVDGTKPTLSVDDSMWLSGQQVQPSSGGVRWRDLFTTGSEFDVFRYQSFLFSAIVGAALLSTGLSQLSSFEIPSTLLGILGLSQAVYVGGKIVSQSEAEKLNKAVQDARVAQAMLQSAARQANAQFVGTAADARAVAPAEHAAFEAAIKQLGLIAGAGVYKKLVEPL